MFRKLNRIIQNYLRPKRLALGRYFYDKKIENLKDNTIVKEENVIENNNIKSIIFLRIDGKIGDMVINTLMFREIKKKYPLVKISVVVSGAARDIVTNNPYIDRIYFYDKNLKGESKSLHCLTAITNEISQARYDLLIDFSDPLKVNQMKFIRNCRAKYNMGLNKKDWKLFDFSINVWEDYHKDSHITEIYGAYLKKLGIDSPSLNYDVFIDVQRCENTIKTYEELIIKSLGDMIVVINPYGASKHRSFNLEVLEKILRAVEEREHIAILIYPPDKLEEMNKFVEEKKFKRVIVPQPIKNILDSAALVKYSDFVITPDTSIVHIARAFDIDMIAIYREDSEEENNFKVWGPLPSENQKIKVIFSRKNIKNGEESDINDFDFSEFESYLNNIEPK